MLFKHKSGEVSAISSNWDNILICPLLEQSSYVCTRQEKMDVLVSILFDSEAKIWNK